jgi:hypothetical protein
MDSDKIITLISQKSFSWAAGILGLYTVANTKLEKEFRLGPVVVGLVLTSLAVIVEYFMWRDGNAFLKARLELADIRAKKEQGRVDKLEALLIERFSQHQ